MFETATERAAYDAVIAARAWRTMMAHPVPRPIPPIVSARAPAMAWCQDSDADFVYWSESNTQVGPTVRWPQAQRLSDQRSETGPAICGTGAHTVLAWRGSGDDDYIWYSSLEPVPGPTPPPGAYRWKPQQRTLFRTPTFPTLTRVGTRTLLFFKARGAEFLRWAELRDGAAEWVNPETGHPNQARDLEWLLVQEGVAATEHQGKLFVAFVRHNSTAIGVMWLDESHRFQFVSMLDDQRTTTVPALTSDGTNLYLAWRVKDDYPIAWSMLTGSGWAPTNTLRDRGTRTGPALGHTGRGKLVMVWPGIDGDTHLWWSQFDNGQWGGQQPFADRQMNGSFRINLA